jgi:hypothetical protein
VEALCTDHDLSDPFRTLNPDLKEFTYYPSGLLRKNRSRIDFFLVSADLYDCIDSCIVAQSFCSRTFDHKPIFLNMKRRRGKGRACVYDSTVNHPLATDVIRCACYRTYIEAAMNGTGPVTEILLRGELERIVRMEDTINDICFVQGISSTRDRTEEEDRRLADLEADLPRIRATLMDLHHLRTFPRRVEPDLFFENLLDNCRKSIINLQSHTKHVESAQKKAWTMELVRLKKENYAANFDRITVLENLLNAASEKFVADRLSNYVKSDILNSEKMTPKYLRIAEKNVEISLSVIKDVNGIPFRSEAERQEHIVSFYENLYKNPATMPNDFSNCE